MNDAIINIKTDAKTKQAAQALAAELGVSLSSLITMTLRDVVRKQRVDISVTPEVTASADEVTAIRKGLAQYQAGEVVTLDEL